MPSYSASHCPTAVGALDQAKVKANLSGSLRCDGLRQLNIDLHYYQAYAFHALQQQGRDLHPAQPRLTKATIKRGFFAPTENTGGIVPIVFCYGGLYWAAL